MRFLRGSGMCLMTDYMRTHSPPSPTPCGGIGDIRGIGDGILLGIIAAGITHPVSGIITITLIGITIIIHITAGLV